MPSVTVEVRQFKVNYICDKCKDGIMVFNGGLPERGNGMHGNGIWPHRCDKCLNVDYLEHIYPNSYQAEIEQDSNPSN